MKKQYIKYIQELSFTFAKYHYDEYIKKNDIKFIPYEKVQTIVESLYSKNMQKELFGFIRQSLKLQLGKEYNHIIVEPLLLEISDNSEIAIERITTEIHEHQEKYYIK